MPLEYISATFLLSSAEIRLPILTLNSVKSIACSNSFIGKRGSPFRQARIGVSLRAL